MGKKVKHNPEISVVVPALNEEKPLSRLFECLERQTFRNFEVIVADAGSKDATRKIAGEHGAQVVEGGLPGVGRNRGASRASGEFLLDRKSVV